MTMYVEFVRESGLMKQMTWRYGLTAIIVVDGSMQTALGLMTIPKKNWKM